METGSPSDVRARVEPEQKVPGGKSHPDEGWLNFSAKSLVRWASSPPTKGEQTGERIMNSTILAIRVLPDNPDHHLWNNNGTWWCHYTVHRPDYTKQRVRVSLGTRCQDVARRLRDRVLQNADAA
jgi:hypothetical protein